MRNKKKRHSLRERCAHYISQKCTKIRFFFIKDSSKKQASVFTRRKKRKNFCSIHIPRNIWQKKKKSILLVWGGLLLGTSILFGIFGPFFKIHSIYISRQGHTINIEQAYASTDYIRGKSIFFLDTREIARRLQKNQAAIQNITFQLERFTTLNINLGSYPIAFQSNGYLILTNGSILQGENKILPDIPHLGLSQEISELSIFRETLDANEIKSIQTLLEIIPKNIPGFTPSNVYFHTTEKELFIINKLGNIFIFDLSGENISSQVEKLAVFQKESEDITQKKYVYIDVRIPGKLFLCGYDEEFQCKQNLKNIYGDSIFTQAFSQSQP